MSKVAIQGNVSGTGTLTIAAPNTNTDRVLNLPDNSGTVFTNAGGTMTGALALPAGGLNVGSGQLAVDASGRVTMPNQPAFQVIGAVTASVSAGSKIEFTDAAVTNVVFNTGGHWSNANDRFTAPVAGKYLFYCAIYYTNGASTYGSIAPRINGSQLTAGDSFILFDGGSSNQGSADNQIRGTFVFDLAANDYVELFVRTGAATLNIYSGHSFFGGHLIG